jgi:5'-3' exonuclease
VSRTVLIPAIEQFDDTVGKIVEELEADKVVVALSDDVNWRKSVMPSYKHNRVAKRKPVIYKAMREYVAETRETYQRPGLEGDDILGILSTHKFLIPGEKIIVSIDKDMNTIPGKLLNDKHARAAMTQDGGTYADHIKEVSESQADFYHMMQTLTGDVTDGYPGCPGIGAVRAEELLINGLVLTPSERVIQRGARKGETEIKWTPTTAGTPWEVVVSAYASAGLSEEVALLNARVARIARAADYDFTNKEIKLWQPANR